ncbi:transferase [Bordetella genomosp. 1]|uniref:Transferase n=1 Tax=Bordetella genomosp. 1 TaxID=1395607 RepID=A0A261SQ52_9BORD|nr:glycosyltransferase family 4 protein [Bordetella genomosp. 1]MDQ8034233.1 glycosyltransferase family 4 protein [Bordetella sp.]OZI39516.1 transferase [Bordetella genomosp. 1]
MKILYTNFHPRNGGGHVTYIINLARALAADHEITVATPGTSRLFRYAGAIPGVKAVAMDYPSRLTSWFGPIRALRRLIDRERFDIIHCNGSSDHRQVMIALMGLRHRPRVIFTKHNDHPLASLGNRVRARLATDHVIAVSDYVRRLISDSPYRDVPVTTVHHGIDTNFYAPPAEGSEAKLHEIYFGADWRGKLLLGSAGGTDFDKGWLDLVDAAGSLPPELRERVRILVAGDPPNAVKLARVRDAGMEGKVIFPGLLDDVRAALAACQVGFVLSYREALSFAAREMMAIGLPVLASNAGGLPENIKPGSDGWVVGVRDVPAIAAVLKSLLADPALAPRMGQAARAKAVREFNLHDFAAATLQVYHAALAR